MSDGTSFDDVIIAIHEALGKAERQLPNLGDDLQFLVGEGTLEIVRRGPTAYACSTTCYWPPATPGCRSSARTSCASTPSASRSPRRGSRRLRHDDKRRQVEPKYADPEQSELTWSGRGHMVRWLQQRLAAGARLEDFLIEK